jgi:hypothetical protein
MARQPYGIVQQQIERLLQRGSLAGLSEWQLLERYATERDELAFEALVARHGPMVLGVCRRVLHHAQAAEDAFQATFLVLMRKAPSLDRRKPWEASCTRSLPPVPSHPRPMSPAAERG